LSSFAERLDGLLNAAESDWLKTFFETLIEEHKGQGLLGSYLSLYTIEGHVQRLGTEQKRKRDIEISEATLKDIRNIRGFSCI
jgi:hypothetical protein